MDELDRLLHQLPDGPPDKGLAEGINQNLRLRRKRSTRIRLVLSSILAVCGTGLMIQPFIGWLQNLQLPDSSFIVLFDLVDIVFTGVETSFSQSVSGLYNLQSTLSSMDALAWPGLAAIAVSTLLALDSLTPQSKL